MKKVISMSLSKRALEHIDWHTGIEEDDDAIVGNWQSTLVATGKIVLQF